MTPPTKRESAPRATRATGRSANGTSGAGSGVRQVGILGILMMGVGVLLLMSIATYSPEDYGLLQSMRIPELALLEDSPALGARNWLGPTGVIIAHTLVFTLFGYASALVPLLLLGAGWRVFRELDLRPYGRTALLGGWSMVLVSVSAGWLHLSTEAFAGYWSGMAGSTMAGVMRLVTGVIGSGVILSVLLIVTTALILRIDLNQVLQRAVAAVRSLGERVGDGLAGWNESRKEAAQRRRERKEEARARKSRERARREEEEKTRQAKEERDREAREAMERQIEAERIERDAHEEGVAHSGNAPSAGQADGGETANGEGREELSNMGVAGEGDAGTDGRGGDGAAHATAEEFDGEAGAEERQVEIVVGKGDEKAGRRELDRQNRSRAREQEDGRFVFPRLDLLDESEESGPRVDSREINETIDVIEEKLGQHRILIKRRDDGKTTTKANVGPSVTLFEIVPEENVKISRIQSYANDLKMATASMGIRIIAPIPGKNAVGIEVPNRVRQTVRIRSLLQTRTFLDSDMVLPVAFGKTIQNEVYMLDLAKLPHLLMAGATGSGKSVGINTIITCLLYKCHPNDLKFVMIDPKKIELSLYAKLRHHYLAYLPDAEEPIVTDTSKALETLTSVCAEMDLRYELLKMAMVRDLASYNEKFRRGSLEEELGHRHLPYIVVIIDELADLMITAGRQIEEPIARIAQLARAVGIHLVIATQRPSVNVITGTIKANFPARIAYQVASKVDSRTILDSGGADELIGKGDMLVNAAFGLVRVQNAFVSTEEVERITDHIANQTQYNQPFLLPRVSEEEDAEDSDGLLEDLDDLFKDAAQVVLIHQQGSVSLLQRKLKVGYNRAGRLIDQLFRAGVVGPYQGSAAREVLVSSEEELAGILDELGVE